MGATLFIKDQRHARAGDEDTYAMGNNYGEMAHVCTLMVMVF